MLLLVQATRVAALRGDDDTAAAAARAAEEAASATASGLLMSCARAAAGLAAYAAGDAATAASELESAIAPLAVTDQATAVDLAVMLADAHRAVGDPASETAAVEQATTMAASGTSQWERARALLGAARRHLHHGQRGDAATAAYEACTLGVELGDTRTQIDAVELLARFEPPAVAIDIRRAAVAARAATGYRLHPLATAGITGDVIEAVRQPPGPAPALADAERRLGRGRGPRGRPTLGWDSLTPAERRVVELVAAGLSNPEIAARLIVSRETIKGHVASALRKVGAVNRADLAARAAHHRRSQP